MGEQTSRPHARAMTEPEYIAHRAAAFVAWLDALGTDVLPGDWARAAEIQAEIQRLRDERHGDLS